MFISRVENASLCPYKSNITVPMAIAPGSMDVMLSLLLLDGCSLVCGRFSAAVTSESLKSEVLDIPWEITQISNLKSLDEKGALAECDRHT